MKQIPSYSKYVISKEGRVFNKNTLKEIKTYFKKDENGNENVPFVRLFRDDKKRVFVDKREVYKKLYQQSLFVDNKTKKRRQFLTKALVLKIRELKEKGVKNIVISKEFNLNPTTVSNIHLQKSYKKWR